MLLQLGSVLAAAAAATQRRRGSMGRLAPCCFAAAAFTASAPGPLCAAATGLRARLFRRRRCFTATAGLRAVAAGLRARRRRCCCCRSRHCCSAAAGFRGGGWTPCSPPPPPPQLLLLIGGGGALCCCGWTPCSPLTSFAAAAAVAAATVDLVRIRSPGPAGPGSLCDVGPPSYDRDAAAWAGLGWAVRRGVSDRRIRARDCSGVLWDCWLGCSVVVVVAAAAAAAAVRRRRGAAAAAGFHGTAGSVAPPPSPAAVEFRGTDWPGRAGELKQFQFQVRPAAAWAAGVTEVTRKPTQGGSVPESALSCHVQTLLFQSAIIVMYCARAAGPARAKASKDSRLLRGLQACLPHRRQRCHPFSGSRVHSSHGADKETSPPHTHAHSGRRQPVLSRRARRLYAPVIRSARREGGGGWGRGGRGCIDPEPAFGDEDTAHSELRWASRRLRRFLRSARCCAALAAAAARLRRGFAAAAGLRAAAAELHAPRRRAAVAAPPRRIRRVSSVHA